MASDNISPSPTGLSVKERHEERKVKDKRDKKRKIDHSLDRSEGGGEGDGSIKKAKHERKEGKEEQKRLEKEERKRRKKEKKKEKSEKEKHLKKKGKKRKKEEKKIKKEAEKKKKEQEKEAKATKTASVLQPTQLLERSASLSSIGSVMSLSTASLSLSSQRTFPSAPSLLPSFGGDGLHSSRNGISKAPLSLTAIAAAMTAAVAAPRIASTNSSTSHSWLTNGSLQKATSIPSTALSNAINDVTLHHVPNKPTPSTGAASMTVFNRFGGATLSASSPIPMSQSHDSNRHSRRDKLLGKRDSGHYDRNGNASSNPIRPPRRGNHDNSGSTAHKNSHGHVTTSAENNAAKSKGNNLPPLVPGSFRPINDGSEALRKPLDSCTTQSAAAAASEAVSLLIAAQNDPSNPTPHKTWTFAEETLRRNARHGALSALERQIVEDTLNEYGRSYGLDLEDKSWAIRIQSAACKEGDLYGIFHRRLPDRKRSTIQQYITHQHHPLQKSKGTFTKEEDQLLLELAKKMNKKWNLIAEELGRTPHVVSTRYRTIYLGSQVRKGRWRAEEIEKLRAVVKKHLEAKRKVEDVARAKAEEERKEWIEKMAAGVAKPRLSQANPFSMEGARMDGLNWDLVAEEVGTRDTYQCLHKWYSGISPSMIAVGDWSADDDRHLLTALLRAALAQKDDKDPVRKAAAEGVAKIAAALIQEARAQLAANNGVGNFQHPLPWNFKGFRLPLLKETEVEWGKLVPDRTEQQCRKRWKILRKDVFKAKDLEFHQALELVVLEHQPTLLMNMKQYNA